MAFPRILGCVLRYFHFYKILYLATHLHTYLGIYTIILYMQSFGMFVGIRLCAGVTVNSSTTTLNSGTMLGLVRDTST